MEVLNLCFHSIPQYTPIYMYTHYTELLIFARVRHAFLNLLFLQQIPLFSRLSEFAFYMPNPLRYVKCVAPMWCVDDKSRWNYTNDFFMLTSSRCMWASSLAKLGSMGLLRLGGSDFFCEVKSGGRIPDGKKWRPWWYALLLVDCWQKNPTTIGVAVVELIWGAATKATFGPNRANEVHGLQRARIVNDVVEMG